jgi:hypothetical protein
MMPTILPLNYFGSIGYFRCLIGKNVLIDVHEHFIKQTERSRCAILSANGPIHLSIPVSKPNGSKTAMKDVVISYSKEWQRIHWKAIESAYASSSFFEDYEEDIWTLITSKFVYLIDFNTASIELVNKWLNLELTYSISDNFLDGEHSIDLRLAQFVEKDIAHYHQLFKPNGEFEKGLSILDILFSEGPMARKWIID